MPFYCTVMSKGFLYHNNFYVVIIFIVTASVFIVEQATNILRRFASLFIVFHRTIV